MILAEIKHYLQQHGRVSLADIALHLDTPPDAVRGMLETLLRKGRIHRHLLNAACGSSCCKCDAAVTEQYEWAASTTPDPQLPHPANLTRGNRAKQG